MRAAAPNRDSAKSRSASANDRFKTYSWSGLAWSMVISALAHAAVFSLSLRYWGTALLPYSMPVMPPEWIPLWITLPPPFQMQSVSQSADAPIVEDAGADAVAEELIASGYEGSGSAASEDLGRLLRASMPAPDVTEPQQERDVEGANSSGRPPIGSDLFTLDLVDLARVDSLDLARLSSLRPELAVMDVSTWMLVRNPTEVRDFMRTRFADSTITGERRATSVTVWIDERGSVGWSEINQSSGRQELDNLALQLFNEVVLFRPAREQGVRVPMSAIFWVHFPW